MTNASPNSESGERLHWSDAPWRHDAVLKGWGRLATVGVEAHEIPGNHAEIDREPNVAMPDKTLKNVLHKAQARTESERMALVEPSASEKPITGDGVGVS